jgi:hypothetical protein
MSECTGNELHEHFSDLTGTYIEHRHRHNHMEMDYTKRHHHASEEHHNYSADELEVDERDTGRKFPVPITDSCISCEEE